MSFHAVMLGILVIPHVLCPVIHHKRSVGSHKGQTGIFATLNLFTGTAALCATCCISKTAMHAEYAAC